MRKILLMILLSVACVSCDLQPKISSLPDTVGDFISVRYPALLADPNTEPEIYNSAAGDYGVYASPELYGSVDMNDYVNYAGMSDYVLIENEDKASVIVEQSDENLDEKKETNAEEPELKEDNPEIENENPIEETDVLDIPEYQTDEINVPARAAVGTVIVKRGDTLYAIARENGMTLNEIAHENNLVSPYTIRIGQVLKIKNNETPVKNSDEIRSTKIETKPVDVEKKAKTIPAKISEKIEPKKTEAKPDKVESKPKVIKQTEVRVPLKDIKVARGDTLYSISRQYSVPVNDLAVMNGLSAPFTLAVGQTLRVPDLVTSVSEQVKKSVKEEVKPEKPKDVEKRKVSKPVEKNVPEQKKQSTPKKTEVKKETVKKTEQPKKVADTKKTIKAEPEIPKIAARSSSKFSWPVRGTILSHYGAKTGGLYNDGINISAVMNTSVVAAENGVVAYAGNEVRGMGNLVIIQHADGWMTVYAHMNSMSVRRGARVSVGQKIGVVGQTGKVTTPQLHFEIRKGTKAYNPINYLKK